MKTNIDFDKIADSELKKRNQPRILFFGIVLISAIWVVPFYYVVVSVFKTTPEYLNNNPLALPESFFPIFENIVSAWTNAKMGMGFLNSTIYGLVGGSLAIFFALMASYGLTRFDFKGKNFWFLLIFSGTVFPLQMYLIPLFFAYQKIGILNTHFGMILFYTSICIPFPTLVLRNYMNGISREMDEASRMDGASEWIIFLRIITPNCWGAMAATFLLQFTWIWNDLLFSTILANKTEVRSIMLALRSLQGSYSNIGPNVIMTAAVVVSVPLLIIFFVLRRHFMAGMKISHIN